MAWKQLLHPGKLTWNLKITCLKRKRIFQTFIFVVHVNFQGCMAWPAQKGIIEAKTHWCQEIYRANPFCFFQYVLLVMETGKLETTQKKIINLELQFTGIPYNKCNNPGGLWGFRQVGFPQKWLHRTCRKLEWIPPERRNRPMIITEIRGPIASSSDGGRRQRRK